MCQLPLIRMWVTRIRSPEKYMRIHLPSASTSSIVRPATDESWSTRASCGSCVSNFVTTCPASARFNVRAARKIVSPSGIRVALVLFVDAFLGDSGVVRRSRDAAHLVTRGRGHEPTLFQKAREE